MINSSNTYWIAGKHAVKAALNNTQRIKLRLCITKEIKLDDYNIKELFPEILKKEQISNLIGNSIPHQGIALQVKTLSQFNINEFLNNTKDNKDIIIILDKITDTQNIGAIIRSAQAFNASAIICQEKYSPKENTLIAKAAAGALEFIPIIYVKNISQVLKILNKNNYWSIGLDSNAENYLHQMSSKGDFFKNNIALVMGSEGKGLRDLVAKNCDVCCKIDIHPSIDSLNVSAALAIALYEVKRSQKI